MTNVCFPVFGRLALFGAALAVPIFASLSLSAADIDLKDRGYAAEITKDKVTDTYTNSDADKVATLTFTPGGGTKSYEKSVSGNVKVIVSAPTAADKYFNFKSASSHTGGTVAYGAMGLAVGSSFNFGTQPIELVLGAKASECGALRAGSGNAALQNDVNVTGTASFGYQTKVATFQNRVASGTAKPVTFAGTITAENCGEISVYHGNGNSQGMAMNFNGSIKASGTDVYLVGATNSIIAFNNDVTAKRLCCAYYTDAERHGRITLAAGKSFTFDAIELAGHYLTVNGALNEACVLSFTPTVNASGVTSVDNAVNAATYSTDDPEISKMTFGADQTVNCVTGVALTPVQAEEPGMVLTGAGKTLTLKCAQSLAECSAKVSGSLGLALNATENSNCQVFLARANDTTGAITVEKGVFRIGAGASFASVTSVSVGADGTLEIASLEANPISSGAELSLATGASLTLADGAALTVARVLLDGVQVTKVDALKAITFTGDAAAFTVTDEPMSGTFFYGAANVSLTAKTGWYTDRELTTPSGEAPVSSGDPDKPNVYVVCDGKTTAKVSANTTFGGDVLQFGDPETAGNATFNAGTTTIGNCRIYGGSLELNNDGTLHFAGDYELFNGTKDIVFRDSYISTSERKIAFSGSFATAEDVDVTLTGLYGSGVKISTGLDYKSGSMIVDGDFSAFKGSLVAQTPKYSGDNIHLPFYVELTSATAFGDATCERSDALVLGNECVLRLGPDVVSSAARGITLDLTATQTAQIDTSAYGDAVLNAPLAGDAGTLEKIGAGKLTLTGTCGVEKILVSSGSLRLEKTATFPKGTTVEVAAGATVYYWEEQLQQGLVLTGLGNKRLLGQGLVLILE